MMRPSSAIDMNDRVELPFPSIDLGDDSAT
jgi:hypothetical protein